MSTDRKLPGRPPLLRELRAMFGLDPDGSESVLHRLVCGPKVGIEVVDVAGDPLATREER